MSADFLGITDYDHSVLPPAPWHVVSGYEGVRVLAGDTVVCDVYGPNDRSIANIISKLPELLALRAEIDDAELATIEAEMLNDENKDLLRSNESLHAQILGLQEKLAEEKHTSAELRKVIEKISK